MNYTKFTTLLDSLNSTEKESKLKSIKDYQEQFSFWNEERLHQNLKFNYTVLVININNDFLVKSLNSISSKQIILDSY